MNTENKGNSFSPTERIRRGLAILGIVIGFGGACAVASEISIYLQDTPSHPDTLRQHDAVEMAEGPLLSEEEFVARLNEYISQATHVSAEPQVIRSIVYHALRFNGVADTDAAQYSARIDIGGARGVCGADNAACMHTTSDGTVITIDQSYLEHLRTTFPSSDQEWMRLLEIMSHEAAHEAVAGMRGEENIDMGIIGSLNLHRPYGFAGESTSEHTAVTELIQGRLLVDNGQVATFTVPEEFYAIYASHRYMEYLSTQKGLSPGAVEAFSTQYISGYIMMRDAVRALDMPVWQQFWGEALNFDHLKNLHGNSNLQEFYYGIGQALLEKRTDEVALSPEDTRALGMVGFSLFAYSPIPRDGSIPPRLQQLLTAPLDPEGLRQLAAGAQEWMRTVEGIAES